jgi:hypothetical protein
VRSEDFTETVLETKERHYKSPLSQNGPLESRVLATAISWWDDQRVNPERAIGQGMFVEFSSKPAPFADAMKTTRDSLGSEHSTSFVFVWRLTCEVTFLL